MIMIQHPRTMTCTDSPWAAWETAASRTFQGGPGAQQINTYVETKSQKQKPDSSGPFSQLHNLEEKKKKIEGTKDQTPLLSGDPSLLSRKLLDAQRNQAQASLNPSFRDTVRILSVPPCAFSLCLSFPLRNIHTELGPPTTESTQ